jgi:hypothetical protein
VDFHDDLQSDKKIQPFPLFINVFFPFCIPYDPTLWLQSLEAKKNRRRSIFTWKLGVEIHSCKYDMLYVHAKFNNSEPFQSKKL